MFKFLSTLFGREKSGEVAKERLQLVLIHDRNDISPEVIDSLRIEMINVIKKYLEIDEQGIELAFDREIVPLRWWQAYLSEICSVPPGDGK